MKINEIFSVHHHLKHITFFNKNAYFNNIESRLLVENLLEFLCPLSPKQYELKERFGKMLESGLVEETKTILELSSEQKIKVLETVGYKQVAEFIKDKISYEEMIELATNATYQLAKRQITWLKKFNLDKTFFSDEDDKVMKILSIIKN